MDQAALESRLANYQRLLAFSHVLTSTLDLSALLDLIVHTAQDLTNTEGTSILLIDPKTGDLFFEAVSGNKSEEVKREIVSPDSIVGWVARHGQPQIISDVSQDHRFSKKTDEGSGFRTRSLVAVPMKVNDRVIGVVEAVNRRGDAPFTAEDLEVLTVLSAQAAVAIENLRLFQQNDFVSEMVHELRTPLTSIIAYTELILRQEIPLEQAQGFIETIFQEANRLSKMTNDFLDFSRLQSGRARFNMTALDLAALTQEVTTLLKPQADEHSPPAASRATRCRADQRHRRSRSLAAGAGQPHQQRHQIQSPQRHDHHHPRTARRSR